MEKETRINVDVILKRLFSAKAKCVKHSESRLLSGERMVVSLFFVLFPKKHDSDGDDEDKFPPLVVRVFKWFLKKARSINVSRPFVCRPRQRLNLTDVCSVAKRATVAKTELKTFCVTVLLPKMSHFLSAAQISGFSKWRHLVVAQCVATVSKNPQKLTETKREAV